MRLLIQRAAASLVVIAAVFVLVGPAPAVAQSTGMVKGKVVDAKGQPVEGAKISIVFAEGVNRKFETKTNKRGEFMQIGLMPGAYKLTAEKENVGTQSFDTRVRLGQTAEVNFMLGAPAPGSGGLSKEMAAAKTAFEEGVAAAKSNNPETAIAKFTEAAGLIPNCFDCYYNIAQSHMQKKAYTEAEAAFKKAIELKPDSAEAYNGLATLYNAQKKFDEAAAASVKAVELSGAAGAPGGGSADALYNQGVILWNAGKPAEAAKQFEAAIAANPNHADAHFQYGLALVAQGKLAESVSEFEAYLRIAPDGPNAAQAKSFIAQLKKDHVN